MRILVAGNSQVACLKAAWSAGLVPSGDAELFFYCIPGGYGPDFEIQEDRLVVPARSVNKDYPPFADPPETPGMPLSSFDAVLVSAPGHIGGGFAFSSDLLQRGVLHEFGPREGGVLPYVSASCYTEVIRAELAAQAGVRFLTTLREAYSGRIIVQPFPRITSTAPDRADWILNTIYQDGLGAMRFFGSVRDAFLAERCAAVSAELLPHPAAALAENGLTDGSFFDRPDGLHPNRDYGAMVLEQVLGTPSDRFQFPLVPMGEDGFLCGLLARRGFAPAGALAEAAGPFESAIHPLPVIGGLISNRFDNYMPPGAVEFDSDRNFCIHRALNIRYPGERGEHHADNDCAALRSIYLKKTADFNALLDRGGPMVFLLHVAQHRPNLAFHLRKVLAALEQRLAGSRYLLVCVRTWKPDEEIITEGRAKLDGCPVEFIDVRLPVEGYVPHVPKHHRSPAGKDFEKNLDALLDSRITEWAAASGISG